MTWERTAAAESSASPESVWAVLIDGRRWSRWYDGVDWMVAEGPIAPGTVVTLKPRRFRQTAFHIEDATPSAVLALVVTFGPVARMRLRWEIRPHGEGSTTVQRVEVAGPLGAVLLRRTAERIASAMPANLERLAAIAAER